MIRYTIKRKGRPVMHFKGGAPADFDPRNLRPHCDDYGTADEKVAVNCISSHVFRQTFERKSSVHPADRGFVKPRRYRWTDHDLVYYNPKLRHVPFQLCNGADVVCDIVMPIYERTHAHCVRPKPEHWKHVWHCPLFFRQHWIKEAAAGRQGLFPPLWIDVDEFFQAVIVACRSYERTGEAADIHLEVREDDCSDFSFSSKFWWWSRWAWYWFKRFDRRTERLMPFNNWFPFIGVVGWAIHYFGIIIEPDPKFADFPHGFLLYLFYVFVLYACFWSLRGLYRGARRLAGYPCVKGRVPVPPGWRPADLWKKFKWFWA